MVDMSLLAAIFAIVAPLYAAQFVTHYKMGLFSSTPEDVEEAEDQIIVQKKAIMDIRNKMVTEEDIENLRDEMAKEENLKKIEEAIIDLHEDHEKLNKYFDYTLRGGDSPW